MKQALIIIDYIESCCLEEYKDVWFDLGLSKVRSIASSLQELITFYREQKRGEVIWITACPWVKGYVHPNVERLYEENPEAEFYSNTLEGNNFYLIQPEKNEQVFEKNLYSAFSGTQGKLEVYLKSKDIEHLIISGIYSTGCVNATICEAFHHGYKLTIIGDCVETFDDEDRQAFQRNLFTDWAYMYGKVVNLADFMKSEI
ncbi:isochorismatase family cysteine hydrolase [Chloroflexota bacterium]